VIALGQAFLDYLHEKGLIKQAELEIIAASSKKEFEKRDLFFTYFYGLSEGQINQVKAFVQGSQSLSFEYAAIALGFVDENETSLHDESDELPSVKLGQEIINEGFMGLEAVVDALTIFNMGMDVSPIDLPEEQLDDTLADRYLLIVEEGFVNSFYLNVSYGKTTTVSSLSSKAFIFQSVTDGSNIQFLAGIAADEDVLRDLASNLYKRMNSDARVPEFEDTKENAIDFFCETLNLINGICTYRFEVDFDLEAPGYQEQAILKAPKIYVTEMTVLSHVVKLLFIYGASYIFHEKGAKGKVLIVDDSKTARNLLKSLVLEMGHEVVGEAINGLDGYDKYFALKPDIVLTDITMPIMDGVTFIQKLIQSDKNAKIITISSNASQKKLFDAISAGAFGFLFKPINKDEFEALIEQALNG